MNFYAHKSTQWWSTGVRKVVWLSFWPTYGWDWEKQLVSTYRCHIRTLPIISASQSRLSVESLLTWNGQDWWDAYRHKNWYCRTSWHLSTCWIDVGFFALGPEGSTGSGVATSADAGFGLGRLSSVPGVVMNQDTRIILVALGFLIVLFVAVFALTTWQGRLSPNWWRWQQEYLCKSATTCACDPGRARVKLQRPGWRP